MLRISELRLPLDHPPEALRAALVQRLGVDDADLLAFCGAYAEPAPDLKAA